MEANAAAAATTSAGRWQTERRQRCGHGVAQLRPGVGGGRGGGDRGRQLAWPPDGARHGGSVGSSPPFRLWKLGPGQTPAALQWGLPTDPPPPLVTPHPPRPAFPPLEGEEKHAEEMGALPSLPVRSPLLNVVADTGTSFSSRVPPLPPTAPPSPSPPAHASASQARERQSGRHPSWAKGGEPPHCARLATGRPCVSFPPNGCRGGGQRAGMTAGRGQGAAPRRGRGSAPAAGIWPAGPLAAVRKAGSRSPPPPPHPHAKEWPRCPHRAARHGPYPRHQRFGAASNATTGVGERARPSATPPPRLRDPRGLSINGDEARQPPRRRPRFRPRENARAGPCRRRPTQLQLARRRGSAIELGPTPRPECRRCARVPAVHTVERRAPPAASPTEGTRSTRAAPKKRGQATVHAGGDGG